MRRPHGSPCAALLAPLLAFGIVTAAAAALAQNQSPLSPLLEVQVLGRELLAIDSEGGGQRSERLERGETVLYTRSQGRVGVVVTDRRLLAIATRSGSWQQARYRHGEPAPADVEIGDRVALALMQTRAVGFDGGSRNIVESSIGPRETVVDSAVGPNVVVVITDRRALGLSADRGGFFEVPIRLGEQIQSLTAFANHATLQTSQRLLIFRGPAATWEEKRLPVH
jgi:hypothetical protein